MSKKQTWPSDCIWPEPLWDGCGTFWEAEDAELTQLDEEGQDLLDIKDYFDSLVEDGFLNEDYTLRTESGDWLSGDESEDAEYEFVPELGEEYWDNGFLVDAWEEDLSDHMNLLKLDYCSSETDPTIAIREVIDYDFVNENLLRQAFTRRAFAIEHGISVCNEELEFLGDSVLNSIITKEIVRQLMEVDIAKPEAPFRALRKGFDEGVLTRIRSKYVSKEHLAGRASELGLDRYILYGAAETPSESSREDVMEALIGAVALDCGWDEEILAGVVDRLIGMQLTYPDAFLKKTYYDLFNAWHQRHFGERPSYEVSGLKTYYCTIRFHIPENKKGIPCYQRIDVSGFSRSEAREEAALRAYSFVVGHGLWLDLKEAGIIPDIENSINQLQELYQKKYVQEKPVYEFEEWGDQWNCDCVCDGVNGYGKAASKTQAKKKAAYMVLVRLLKAAGEKTE